MRRCVEHFALLDSRCSAELVLLPAVAEQELDFDVAERVLVPDVAERVLVPDVAEQAPSQGSTAEQALVAAVVASAGIVDSVAVDLGIADVAVDTVAEVLVHEVAVLER